MYLPSLKDVIRWRDLPFRQRNISGKVHSQCQKADKWRIEAIGGDGTDLSFKSSDEDEYDAYVEAIGDKAVLATFYRYNYYADYKCAPPNFDYLVIGLDRDLKEVDGKRCWSIIGLHEAIKSINGFCIAIYSFYAGDIAIDDKFIIYLDTMEKLQQGNERWVR